MQDSDTVPIVDEVKVVLKSKEMSKIHLGIFAFCLFVLCGIVLALSNASTPMLIYNESEVYSCPKDYIAMVTKFEEAALNSIKRNFTRELFDDKPQDKSFKVEPFTGGQV